MSEEIKEFRTGEEKYSHALCHKHFWMGTLAVFLGVYLALSVFAFIHKPPFSPIIVQPSPYSMQCPCMNGACPCHQKMMMKKFLKQHMDFIEDARKLQDDN